MGDGAVLEVLAIPSQGGLEPQFGRVSSNLTAAGRGSPPATFQGEDQDIDRRGLEALNKTIEEWRHD